MTRIIFVFLLTTVTFIVKGQSIGHITPQLGTSYSEMKTSDKYSNNLTSGISKLGVGLSVDFPIKTFRFDYSIFYTQENFEMNYSTPQKEQNYLALNHVLQNQFLFVIKDEKNIFNLRMGINWEWILYHQKNKDGYLASNAGTLYTGNGDKKIYNSIYLNVGVGFVIGKRILMAFDYAPGITDWYITGYANGWGQDYDGPEPGESMRKRSWTLTLGYLIYRKKKEVN